MSNHQASTSQARELAGVIGFFKDAHALLEATQKVRDAKYKDFDAYTPYPIHGLEAAAGIKRSPLPYVTFAAGLTGTICAFLFQYWTSAVDWPIIVGGKPMNSWPAFVPVMFELTILFAGLATFGGLLVFCGLPNTTRKIFDPGITRDKYALVIEAPLQVEEDDWEIAARAKAEAGYKSFDEAEAAQFLKGLGAQDVRSVYHEGWF
jgi:hypothetical protein